MICPLYNRIRRGGFSTPELLMTLVVFSFGLLPLIVLFQSSHKTTAQAKNLMVAQSLGRLMIDEMRALGFDGVKRNKSDLVHDWKQVTGRLVKEDSESTIFPDYYGKFEYKVGINSDVEETESEPSKYRIELEIQWQEPNRKFSMAFGTVVVKYGAK